MIIEAGRVRINGATATLGERVDVVRDEIEVDGQQVGSAPGLVYYLLNKPRGVVSTSKDTHGRPTVVDLVPPEPRVYSIGRLDADSEGLLLLTNDGVLAQHLMHPSHGVEKEYLVEVESGASGVPRSVLSRLQRGVELADGLTAPAKVSQPNPGVLRIVLHEGRNRQIRRMCESVGFPVRRLVRVRIGPVMDSRLGPGSYRALEMSEVRGLYEASR